MNQPPIYGSSLGYRNEYENNNYNNQYNQQSYQQNQGYGYNNVINSNNQVNQPQSYPNETNWNTNNNYFINNKSIPSEYSQYPSQIPVANLIPQKNLTIKSQTKMGFPTQSLKNWDLLLKQKNFNPIQSSTQWIHHQQQSWLQPTLSTHIQQQSDLKFAFPNPYIKYKIIPGVNQKMTLDVTAKDDLDKGLIKGNLIIWDYHGGPNQQFFIHKEYDQQGHQQYILINASTGFCVSAMNLTVAGQQTSKIKNHQNRLCVYPKQQNSKTQRWRLIPKNSKKQIYQIQSVLTEKVLDCENQSSSNGTNVIQWDKSSAKNQLWKILPA